MDLHKNTICPLAWRGLNVDTLGFLRPCCVSSAAVPNAKASSSLEPLDLKEQFSNSPFLRNLRLSMLRGEKPSTCDHCWKSEAAGVPSMRQHMLDLFPFDQEVAQSLTDSGGNSADHISYFDVRAGNKCNLICRMCREEESAAWKAEAPIVNRHTKWPVGSEPNWADHPLYWDQLLANVENSLLHHDRINVMLAGGEPLLSKNHYLFIEKCVERGLSERIILRYTSNITIVPTNILSLWNSFCQILFGVSLDGVGAVNEYIRYPSSWQKIEKNLALLLNHNNIIAYVQPCVSIYNVYYLPEMFQWGYQHSQNYQNHMLPMNVQPHLVHDPFLLNIQNLPEVVMKKLKIKFDSFKGREEDQNFLNGLVAYWESRPGNLKMDEFWNYTNILDQSRNQSLKRSMPEWFEVLDAPKVTCSSTVSMNFLPEHP